MTNSCPIISFVVPVFNAEPYLEECLNSIIRQKSFCDCEVICVDDKSTDRSCEIITEYEKRHSNIHLIRHSVNKKAGGARNTGINAAVGQYLWFIDSDDTIADGSLEKVITQVQYNDLDIYCFNISLKYENTEQICGIFKESTVTSGYQFLKEQWGKNLICYLGYPCIAVARRSIVTENNITFIENTTYGEDTTFITEIIAESDRVSSTAEPFYNYRQGHTSSTSLLMKSWKGVQIYESIFVAGNLVVNNLIERHRGINADFSNNIEQGMPWFVNRLFFRLLRSSASERSAFFEKLQGNKEIISSVSHYLDTRNRFIVSYPFIARIFLNIISPIYKTVKNNRTGR